MFRIIDILQDFTDRQTGARSIMVESIADTAADLPQNTAQLVYIIGSYADVIDTGDRYKINSAGQWIRQPNQNTFDNVYTKSEIDALLQGKQNTLSFDAISTRDSANMLTSGGVWDSVWSQVLGVNSTKNLSQDVPETGYDCNTLTDVGIYRVPSAEIAESIANIPTNAAGRLIVSNLGLGNRYIQIYLASGARVFIRSYVSTGWQAWFEYQGIENMTDYSWGRFTVEETTGNVVPSTTRLGSEEYFPISGGAVLTYNAYRTTQMLQTFYLFYGADKTYLGNTSGTGYIGWIDAGIPIRVPSAARYYRVAFRRSGDQTITRATMIKCTRQIG